MPPTTRSEFGDIVLVPFPFTDRVATAAKKNNAQHKAGREREFVFYFSGYWRKS